MATHIFGIRHHGPGSARSLRQALEQLVPDCILVEGPPDAAEVLPLLTHEQMRPPVALLIYRPDMPSRAVYYPFTEFSPEWQAIEYGLSRTIPIRFMDLPQACAQAVETPEPDEEPSESEALADDTEDTETADAPDAETDTVLLRRDPLRWLAEAAGHSDGESWWEHMVEQRRDTADLFQALMEAMTALRQAAPPDPDLNPAQREASMRQTIRAAEKEGFERIAVVCGAWHAPVLADRPPAKQDAELLKGLPKVKVAATWVPWTFGRLTKASGYGAGVSSPAYYGMIWDAPEQVAMRWLTSAARLLRDEDLPASPASVIEAVRLSESLATVRDRPAPGLRELWEAAQSIFCFGSAVPMQLIEEKLVVGERLGRVPDETPMLPIQQDLRREQKRLRLAPEAAYSDKDLDLRNATDLERSWLLHRLNLLGIPWGAVLSNGKGKGTFHELWRLQWQPEFEISLIEANVWGASVRDATGGRVREVVAKTESLGELTALVERCLLADLPESVQILMTRLEELAAVTSDVPHLMDAVPPLAGVLRYGNVRQTDTAMVARVLDGLVTRVCVGLGAACSSLNDDAAAALFPRLMAFNYAVNLLQSEEYQTAWQAALRRLADQAGVHGLITGRCCRLLIDQQVWEPEQVGERLNLALSPANDPSQSAAWIDGLLRDSGELLVHFDGLWSTMDRWTASLAPDVFVQLLPLLRRTFSTFTKPLRRQLGERASGGAANRARNGRGPDDIDTRRAEKVLPLVALILGVKPAEVNR